MMNLNSMNQLLEDTLSPHLYPRWTFTVFTLLIYAKRIFKIKSHAGLSYCVGVYLLHSIILFVTPKDENIPDLFENVEDEEYNPRNIDNDFRPYVRKLPEFQFWKFSAQVICIAYFLTFFSFTIFPLSPYVLITYFISIVLMTIYKIHIHSKKYKYNIFFSGKSTLEQ